MTSTTAPNPTAPSRAAPMSSTESDMVQSIVNNAVKEALDNRIVKPSEEKTESEPSLAERLGAETSQAQAGKVQVASQNPEAPKASAKERFDKAVAEDKAELEKVTDKQTGEKVYKDPAVLELAAKGRVARQSNDADVISLGIKELSKALKENDLESDLWQRALGHLLQIANCRYLRTATKEEIKATEVSIKLGTAELMDLVKALPEDKAKAITKESTERLLNSMRFAGKESSHMIEANLSFLKTAAEKDLSKEVAEVLVADLSERHSSFYIGMDIEGSLGFRAYILKLNELTNGEGAIFTKESIGEENHKKLSELLKRFSGLAQKFDNIFFGKEKVLANTEIPDDHKLMIILNNLINRLLLVADENTEDFVGFDDITKILENKEQAQEIAKRLAKGGAETYIASFIDANKSPEERSLDFVRSNIIVQLKTIAIEHPESPIAAEALGIIAKALKIEDTADEAKEVLVRDLFSIADSSISSFYERSEARTKLCEEAIKLIVENFPIAKEKIVDSLFSAHSTFSPFESSDDEKGLKENKGMLDATFVLFNKALSDSEELANYTLGQLLDSFSRSPSGLVYLPELNGTQAQNIYKRFEEACTKSLKTPLLVAKGQSFLAALRAKLNFSAQDNNKFPVFSIAA